MVARKINILAIVGPTASGKTSLSIKIAKNFNGEVISADSRTQYLDMDIATAKPNQIEQQNIKHWGVDIAQPNHNLSIGDFKLYAQKTIKQIHDLSKLPILVGGSGLYINSVMYNYSLAPKNIKLRNELQNKSLQELQDLIVSNNFKMPENYKNKRYLIRSIEKGHSVTKKSELTQNAYIIGLLPTKEILRSNIKNRILNMINAGLYDEIRRFSSEYPEVSESKKANAHRVFTDYLNGYISEEAAIEKAIIKDLQLAKKQMTWFKRNKDIIWFDNKSRAYEWFCNLNKGKL